MRDQQGQILLIPMNLPIRSGETNEVFLSVAAFVKPWLSKVRIFDNIGGSFIKRLDVNNVATVGTILWDFYKGPVDRYDKGNRIVVEISAGSLVSISEAEIIAGKNTAAIENSNGDWEILQFMQATLVAENQYELSHFIRGKYGSEYAMENPVNASARFVLLDDKITKLSITTEEILGDISIKYGPANKVIEHASYLDANWRHQGVGLMPLAPVRVNAKRLNNDIKLSWIRQTRSGGENWAINQVPLNEQTEAYEVEIFTNIGVAVLREISCDIPSLIYSEAQQLIDFGQLASEFKIKIYQISAQIGRGRAKEIIINV